MVIFLFFTIYTEHIVWQMYICTIELGIQNKYISKSVKYVLFSNMFFKELSGNFGI